MLFIRLAPFGRLALLGCCLCCLVATACDRDKAGPGNGSAATNTSRKQVSGPGIDFVRKSAGLPTQTLDYAGTSAAALAGAKASGDVFFGESKRGDLDLFRRNVRSNERTFVTQVRQFHDGSLAASEDGKRIVYCRFRRLGDIIDDPSLTYPDPVAVTQVYDVASGKEQQVFDFSLPEFRRWRANGVQPFISADGKTVVQLAYDSDRMLFHKQVEEWLMRELRLQEPPADYSDAQRAEDEELTAALLARTQVKEQLKAAGLDVQGLDKSSPKLHDTMVRLYEATAEAEAALLVWQDGQARALKLEFDPKYASYFHYITAAGSKYAILSAEDPAAEFYAEQPVIAVDLATGEHKLLDVIAGSQKLFALSPDEAQAYAVFSPIDPATKVLEAETRMRRLSLTGADHEEVQITGDYLGVLDLSADGMTLAGQDSATFDIYLVDLRTNQRERISEQLSSITGLFVDSTGETLIYLASGVTFKIDLSEAGRKAQQVTAADFRDYQAAATKFLQDLGFVLPASGIIYRFEERKGLGVHEVAVELSLQADTEKAILMRVDAVKKQVVSLWFPQGYIIDTNPDLEGTNLDYYDAENLAKKLLDRSGWMAADKRVIYQPGPNPLYDQRTDSYIVTFREKYQLASDTQVAYANEATVRVGGKTGQILEMTLTANAQVQSQPLTVGRDRLDFLVRNIDEMALPAEAPVRVDVEGARLIVYTVRKQEEKDGMMIGTATPRLAWEVDTMLDPEGDLVFTNLIDTETGETLGTLSYMPMAPTATTTER